MGEPAHPQFWWHTNFLMWHCSFLYWWWWYCWITLLDNCIWGCFLSKRWKYGKNFFIEAQDMTYLEQKYFSFHQWMGTTPVSLLSAKILAIWCYLPNSTKLSATSEGTAMWSRELKRCQGCFEKSRRWVCAAKSGMVWAKCETICWSEYYSVSKYPYVLVFLCTCCKCASEEQVCVCKPSNVLLH